MFKGIRDSIFWNDDYEAAWRWHNDFASHDGVNWRWDRRIKEKKAYWKELGKQRRLSATQATYEALLELAEDLFREHGANSDMTRLWPKVANSLADASRNIGYDHQMGLPQNGLPERWKAYYEVHDAEYQAAKLKKETIAKEMTSHRCEQGELEAGWQRLLKGGVSLKVISLWKLAYPRKAGHEIAYLLDFTLKDFVLWMLVYRQHYLLDEQVISGEHLYTANKGMAAGLADNDETKYLASLLVE